jgi:signal transduction histidine kinase/ligand-binding sensor domain-containing protein
MKTGYINIMTRCRVLLMLLLLSFGSVYSQPMRESGMPYIMSFGSNIYGAHTQNYSVIQDVRGLIYVANFAGILEYDGSSWRLITTKNTSQVISLAKDQRGRIYVGAREEFGYLAPNEKGELVFLSLSSRVGNMFNEIFATIHSNDITYFFSENYIFEWNGKLKIIKSEYKIQSAYKVRNSIYLMLKDYGIAIMEKGKIRLLNLISPVGKILDITSMMASGDNDVLFSSSSQGLFLIKNNALLQQFITDTETDYHLKTKVVSCGVILSDKSIALGTERAGILIIGPDGSLRQIINKNNYLNNEFVTDLYIDNNNFLWAALNNGISVVNIPSQISYFDEKSGIGSGVLDILRHKGTIYIADYKGLLYFNPASRNFIQIGSITTAVWSLEETASDIIAATSKGIYRIINNTATKISDGFALKILKSVKYPGRFYICRTDGLFMLENINGNWTDKGRVAGIEEEIRNLAEDNEGNLWLATPKFGILKLNVPANEIMRFDTSKGLSSLQGNFVYNLSFGIVIATDKDTRKYDESSFKFMKFTIPTGEVKPANQWFRMIVESKNGDLWFNHGDETGVSCFEYTGKIYNYVTKPFMPIADFITWTIYPDSNNVVWFGGPEGLIRYDKKIKTDTNRYFTLVRKVIFRGDSVLFGGTFFDENGNITNKQLPKQIPELEYANNSIKFEYSAGYYHPKAGLQYQYYLKGFDKTWSEWTKNTSKEFTNLPSGSYIFQVRSKNIFGETSQYAEFAFFIKTPWYDSIVAYAFYSLGLLILLYYIVKFRSRKLIKEKRFLEKLIEDRTAEISRQKEELQNQSEQLAQKNSELEKINNIVKSINSEINIGSVLQTILEKAKLVRGVEKATALVFDKASGCFKFKASSGWDINEINDLSLLPDEVNTRYLKQTEEIYEDIFYSNDFYPGFAEKFASFEIPQSIIILVVKVDEKTEGFLLLENMRNKQAFKPKDLEFLKNLKEHVVSAFIKSKILEDLQLLLDNLRTTQQQLIQTEKLASLGQLTAGIAHEIQNPLNFVNNFSSLTSDLAKELIELIQNLSENLPIDKIKEINDIINMIDVNSSKINEHGKRASEIVKGMLMHSRGDSGEFQEVDINRLADEYFHLAFHGMRAEHKDFNTDMQSEYDDSIGKVKLVPQDISRVILNIVNNACYAVYEKSKTNGSDYKPLIKIKTVKLKDKFEIIIRDNGIGIPNSLIDKVCNPFFTTKPTGKGTGLGLSISYDIITQTHKGNLLIESVEGEYSEFTITIPI